MNDVMISVSDFSKRYGSFTAVDSISFEILRGEIFGLLGPNGAGKTTTLECLEGLRKPDSGVLAVAGVDPSRKFSQLKNLIGVQLQTSGLPESITVEEAMRFFCAYHGVKHRFDLLERLGLTEKMKAQYHQLSAGQQRRLVLALAAAHNPQVLFLDEPTAGLDVASRVILHDLMREMRAAGTTIILATHDMAEADELSDRVAILLKGKIVDTGTPMQITAAGSGLTKVSVNTEKGCLKTTQEPLPAVQQTVLKDDYAVYYSTDISVTLPEVINRIASSGDALIDLRVERPSLEDRFIEITGRGDVV